MPTGAGKRFWGPIRSRKPLNSAGWFGSATKRLTIAYSLMILLNALAPIVVAQTEYQLKGNIKLDIRKIPFSRFGSYLSVSDTTEFQAPFRQEGIFLRTLHEGGKSAFRIQLVKDQAPVPFTASATPTLLTLSGGGGTVEICFQGPDRLRFRGSGVTLRLTTTGGWTVPYPGSRSEVNTGAMKYMLFPIKGHLKTSTTLTGDHSPILNLSGTSGVEAFETELDAYTSVWQAHAADGTFEEAKLAERVAYSKWLTTMPAVDPALRSGAEVAAYVNWESVVSPSGNLKRPAMLMSKNWMGSVWSWDQTFNAMATTLSDPELAWDQFLLPIDAQDPLGGFPDKWDADAIAWEFSKPPVHGWALAWMIDHGHFGDVAHLSQVYEPLEKWTDWYFRYRDSNGNGLPEYRHGNESGWDNSTVMIGGTPVESPDLSTYLILQMETLSDMASRLGRPAEALKWKQRSAQLLARMLARFWTGNEFVAFSVVDNTKIHSDSLLLTMPILLGNRLPPEVRSALVKDLMKRSAESAFGLPSEPPNSPFYQADGYWRGPIWAPSTMIIVEGLDRMGEHDFADSLRRKFSEMAQRSGMAENFDALTGTSLRDPAYTWTSSVYLLFANELATHPLR